MSNLKSLTFVTAPPKAPFDRKVHRRHRLIDRLEEQRRLAKDASYTVVVKRTKVAEDGAKVTVEHVRRVRPWWTADANGSVVLTVRVGLKILEFEKGRSAIAVGSADGLDDVLATLIAATHAGELDGLLETFGSHARKVVSKKVA
ncbi:hypothetical protein J2X48_002414 [Bosea sp. BE271]|uniref:DUF6641 family protein n=1 Tax=Bosea TaxID=85413 RepID=UPI00285845A4|nr:MULTISPECIES: DUF6641 family protein [Bosea]MDR6828485.1 hypothetical protein [Bosea robiniae]MDR6895144.1 hypothetical protein [Bosea sp. BE109]MDR7138540.1 hypothetical protein [Bosea sp. BE168]MDR7175485.1 hypothetical protein [Bosea sp. BE271]